MTSSKKSQAASDLLDSLFYNCSSTLYSLRFSDYKPEEVKPIKVGVVLTLSELPLISLIEAPDNLVRWLSTFKYPKLFSLEGAEEWKSEFKRHSPHLVTHY